MAAARPSGIPFARHVSRRLHEADKGYTDLQHKQQEQPPPLQFSQTSAFFLSPHLVSQLSAVGPRNSGVLLGPGCWGAALKLGLPPWIHLAAGEVQLDAGRPAQILWPELPPSQPTAAIRVWSFGGVEQPDEIQAHVEDHSKEEHEGSEDAVDEHAPRPLRPRR